MGSLKAIALQVGLVWSLTSVGAIALAQQPANDKAMQTALQHFLDVDCELGREGKPLADLLKVRAALKPKLQAILDQRLMTLLRTGPDSQAVERIQRSLEEQWTRRAAFLKKNPKLLKQADLRILTEVTKETYVNQRRALFIRKYRERSAIALAAIGTPEGLKTLRELGITGDELLRAAIKAALARYHSR